MDWSASTAYAASGMGVTTVLQEGPADTTGYMVLGFAVILGTMALYLLSLVNRRRNFKRDLQVLDEVEGRQSGGDMPTTGQGS